MTVVTYFDLGYPAAMDRLDIEELVGKMVDQVQFSGYAVRHEVEDADLLRKLFGKKREHAAFISAPERRIAIQKSSGRSAAKTNWPSRTQRPKGGMREAANL